MPSTQTFKPLFWTRYILVLARIVRTGNSRLWLCLGVLAGLGLENKHSTLERSVRCTVCGAGIGSAWACGTGVGVVTRARGGRGIAGHQRKNSALEFLDGYIVWSRREVKRRFTADRVPDQIRNRVSMQQRRRTA